MTLLRNAARARAHSYPARLPRRQRGVVLFIALIMLVAMTLAGIAMVRSVDTTLGIAGNLAFRQTTIQSADPAVKVAFDWLSANTANLITNNPAAGYAAANSELNWFNINAWNQAILLNGGVADAAGNVTRYIIHRMCPFSGAVDPVANPCSTYKSTGVIDGGSFLVGAPKFSAIPQYYYRVSVRVDGPRNTTSVTQAFIII
jgi:type IV pilus assembly protein PilX